MNNHNLVEVAKVAKVFHTRHFFHRDEETNKRRIYAKHTVVAADNIEFAIKPGEVFGLLGPNGAGKTTTVKMISGLVKPSSGVVYVDGLNVEKKRLKALRRIGVVLEGTRTSIWPLTPLENLAYFGNLKDVRGRVLRARSRELLKFIGLQDKMNVQVRRLSRGQRQKLAICIALIADPPVLLLDEPTTGLDVQSSRTIKDKVVEMTREQGKAVLVTTHDMGVAQEICDRIGIISHGRLITCEPTENLLELFAEQTYEFRVDEFADTPTLEAVPGVHGVRVAPEPEGILLTLDLDSDTELRSEALYTVIETLRARGARLRSVTQKQQTLENVFLRLTSAEGGSQTKG